MIITILSEGDTGHCSRLELLNLPLDFLLIGIIYLDLHIISDIEAP